MSFSIQPVREDVALPVGEPQITIDAHSTGMPVNAVWAWSVRFGTDRAIVIATMLLAILGHSLTEKIGINRGLGWDGGVYASWVQDLPAALEEGVGSYHVQKILPIALAHYGLRLFKDTIQERHVIRAFGILNIIAATLVAWLWCKIASELRIGDRGKWLGFAGLILNFAMTKNAYFYPVLTDVMATAVSAAMCYCYLRGWPWVLLLTTLIGAFTSPMLVYVGAILVLFPRNPRLDAQPTAAPLRLNLLLAGLGAYYMGLWCLYVVRDIQGPLYGWLSPVESVLPLSFTLLLLYMASAMAFLLNSGRLFQPSRYWTTGNGWAVAGLLVTILIIKWIQAELMGRTLDYLPQLYLQLIGVAAVAKPAVSLISAATFFGPLIVLAVFLWPRICRIIHQHGLGLTLVIAMGLLQSIDSESRHIGYMIPLLFPFVVKAVEELRWRPSQYGLMMVLALFSTKMWLSIKGNFYDNAFMYPDQLYMMHLGPFMGNEMYVAHVAGIGVAALLIYIVCLQQKVSTVAAMPHTASPPHFTVQEEYSRAG
jgi:hypothetical protein